jgi:hypothetical protein
MPRKVKLTLPQREALGMYAGVRPYVFVSTMTSDWLQRKGLLARSETGKLVLTDKGRCAVDSGYLPT